MQVRFGVHTGLQHTSIAELNELWARIEALGFEWISIWDHFYAADGSGDPHCLEAITSHAALAAATTRVTCGSLVYSAGYRHPAVLANAMATLDQIANGRTVLGLGGGWMQHEYDAYGMRYGSAGERLRMLAEYVQCVRGLLTQDTTTFAGEFFTLTDAQCEPKPVQARLPDLGRRRRREDHVAHRCASTPTAGTCLSSRPRNGRARRTCSTSTAPRSDAIPRRSRRPSTSAWPSPTRS